MELEGDVAIVEHTVWVTAPGTYREVQEHTMEKYMPEEYHTVCITLDDYSDIIAVTRHVCVYNLIHDLDLQQAIYEATGYEAIEHIPILGLAIYKDTVEYEGDIWNILYVGE